MRKKSKQGLDFGRKWGKTLLGLFTQAFHLWLSWIRSPFSPQEHAERLSHGLIPALRETEERQRALPAPAVCQVILTWNNQYNIVGYLGQPTLDPDTQKFHFSLDKNLIIWPKSAARELVGKTNKGNIHFSGTNMGSVESSITVQEQRWILINSPLHSPQKCLTDLHLEIWSGCRLLANRVTQRYLPLCSHGASLGPYPFSVLIYLLFSCSPRLACMFTLKTLRFSTQIIWSSYLWTSCNTLPYSPDLLPCP